ncbi:MAG: hypothetical protein AB1400_04260 [Pseudomonadota bacterium]
MNSKWVVLFCLPLLFVCGSVSSSECTVLTIVGTGEYKFLSSRVLGSGPAGDGGNRKLVDFVSISRPSNTKEFAFDDVKYIWVMYDLQQNKAISCRRYSNMVDNVLRCAANIPERKIVVVTAYDVTSGNLAEESSYKLRSDYIRKEFLENVLECPLTGQHK